MTTERASLEQLEAVTGVVFRHKNLLAQAISQSLPAMSIDHDQTHVVSGERLEFLGDAVLGAAAAAFLYRAYPESDEGQLTSLRSALVRRSTVAHYATDIQLGQYVQIAPAQNGPHGRGTASVLSAGFEAVVGAIFLDQGFARAARFLDLFFRRHLPRILNDDLHSNAKSTLQEYTQGCFHVTPVYRLLERSGPAHDSRFVAEVTVLGVGHASGEGVSRRSAEQAAAYQLLKSLRASQHPEHHQ